MIKNLKIQLLYLHIFYVLCYTYFLIIFIKLLTFIQENTKSCPKCHSSISKIDGCNKMTCGHCYSYFCWLCGKSIDLKNPYQHFTNIKSPCYGLLLDGVEQDVDNLYDIEEEIIFWAIYWILYILWMTFLFCHKNFEVITFFNKIIADFYYES